MICKTIHQMWKDHDVPAECVPYTDSWKQHHPDWNYRFWTDVDILELISTHYNWFLDTYNNYDYNIQRSDTARHVILHHHGGLYCDIDIQCSRPVNDLFETAPDCLLFGENPENSIAIEGDNPHGSPGIVTNSIYYANKHNAFMLKCLKTLNVRGKPQQERNECHGAFILRTTGCVFLDSMYHRWKRAYNIQREPYYRFEKRSMRERQSSGTDVEVTDVEYGTHHSMNSWL